MSGLLEQVVRNAADEIVGFVYQAATGFEAWKRERRLSVIPGNTHRYLGTFESVAAAVTAIER